MPKRDRIQELLEEIKTRRDELFIEYDKLKVKYNFDYKKGKIKFTEAAKKYQKEFRFPLGKYLYSPQIRHFLSIPFIYGMLFPAIFLDIFLFLYQNTAIRLYKIPLVKRSDYIFFDRKHLKYLNLMQKINCLYCSYVNGLFSYAVEVAGRTERYWCPIKAARRKKGGHDWEEYFADYGDPEGFKKSFNSNKDFFLTKNKNKK